MSKDKKEEYVDKLVQVMQEHNIPKLEIDNGTTKIVISNNPSESYIPKGMDCFSEGQSNDSYGVTEDKQ